MEAESALSLFIFSSLFLWTPRHTVPVFLRKTNRKTIIWTNNPYGWTDRYEENNVFQTVPGGENETGKMAVEKYSLFPLNTRKQGSCCGPNGKSDRNLRFFKRKTYFPAAEISSSVGAKASSISGAFPSPSRSTASCVEMACGAAAVWSAGSSFFLRRS